MNIYSRRVGRPYAKYRTLRSVPPETVIVTDGFSCRKQIAQMTGRRALHTAQVIQMALHSEPDQPSQVYPEQHFPAHPADHKVPAALLFGAMLLFVWWLLGRNKGNKSYLGGDRNK